MNIEALCLDIQALKFRWPASQRNVLDIEALQCNQGETIFLNGPSGSGKTTLLSLIGGIQNATEGHISVLNQNLAELTSRQRDQFRADHIGFIFQMFNLIPYLSVLENITLACKFSPERKARIARRGSSPEREARRLLTHLELGADKLDAKVMNLSVGQQQRVATARALIGEPELIIADEPTSALDAPMRDKFIQLLLQESASTGASVLFVSHDPSLETHFQRSLALPTINRAAQHEEAEA